jgi:hypothetical protein
VIIGIANFQAFNYKLPRSGYCLISGNESKMRISEENEMAIVDYVLTFKSEIKLTDTIGLPSLWR